MLDSSTLSRVYPPRAAYDRNSPLNRCAYHMQLPFLEGTCTAEERTSLNACSLHIIDGQCSVESLLVTTERRWRVVESSTTLKTREMTSNGAKTRPTGPGSLEHVADRQFQPRQRCLLGPHLIFRTLTCSSCGVGGSGTCTD